MNMKKIIIVAAACTVALFGTFAICTYAVGVKDDSAKNSTPQGRTSEESGYVKSILDERIKTTYVLLNDGGLADKNNSGKRIAGIISSFDGLYPYKSEASAITALLPLASSWRATVELAGIVDDTTIYTVQRRYDEKIGDYYVYDFYVPDENKDVEPFKGDNDILLAIREAETDYDAVAWDWSLCGLELRVSKRLSEKDFDSISKGSTIEEVTAIDPATAVLLPDDNCKNYLKSKGQKGVLKFDTYHYTNEGIMRITFAREAIGDEFLVSEIELNKTFEFSFDGSPAAEGKRTAKLKINPEHLPE